MTIQEAYKQMEDMSDFVEKVLRKLDKDEVERSKADDIKMEEYLCEEK